MRPTVKYQHHRRRRRGGVELKVQRPHHLRRVRIDRRHRRGTGPLARVMLAHLQYSVRFRLTQITAATAP